MLSTLSLSMAVVACGADAARIKSVEEDDADFEELIPPENFAMIEKGLYRSAASESGLFSFVTATSELMDQKIYAISH